MFRTDYADKCIAKTVDLECFAFNWFCILRH